MNAKEQLRSLTAIVLAAGLSSRLPGENKLLKHIDGRPLVAHALDPLRALDIQKPILVAGHDSGPLIELLRDHPVEIVINSTPEMGMASSISTGIAALPNGVDGFFIVLGDMPFIKPDDYKALTKVFSDKAGASICIPTFEGKRGHPVLFPMHFAKKLRSLEGDQGAKKLLKQYSRDIEEVPRPSDGVLRDFDSISDFDSLQY